MADFAAVEAKVPTLVVSLEMSETELAERACSAPARVNSHHVRRGRASKEDIEKLLEAHAQLAAAPIFIDDQPGQTMLRIAASARRLKLAKRWVSSSSITCNSSNPTTSRANRVERIGAISRRLKMLARELEVPVIALGQAQSCGGNSRGTSAENGGPARIRVDRTGRGRRRLVTS